MLVVLLAQTELPDDPAQLVLLVLMVAAPLANFGTLWYLVRKGKRAPQALKDISEKLDQIQAQLDKSTDRS
jgi:hypothetical protein